jgi:hypothetical protein
MNYVCWNKPNIPLARYRRGMRLHIQQTCFAWDFLHARLSATRRL